MRQKLHRVAATKIACVNGPLDLLLIVLVWYCSLVGKYSVIYNEKEILRLCSSLTSWKENLIAIQYKTVFQVTGAKRPIIEL